MAMQRNARRRAVVFTPGAADIEAKLSRLPGLPLGTLREEWTRRFKTDAGAIRSRTVLMRMLAWQIQADAFGGLDAETRQKLNSIGAKLERDCTYEPTVRRELPPGTILNREWKGVVHTVTRTGDGFRHLGKTYGSLSDVARAITGTRWSGPRFFGLEQKKAAPNTEKIVS
jgi:hypothetical protein